MKLYNKAYRHAVFFLILLGTLSMNGHNLKYYGAACHPTPRYVKTKILPLNNFLLVHGSASGSTDSNSGSSCCIRLTAVFQAAIMPLSPMTPEPPDAARTTVRSTTSHAVVCPQLHSSGTSTQHFYKLRLATSDLDKRNGPSNFKLPDPLHEYVTVFARWERAPSNKSGEPKDLNPQCINRLDGDKAMSLAFITLPVKGHDVRVPELPDLTSSIAKAVRHGCPGSDTREAFTHLSWTWLNLPVPERHLSSHHQHLDSQQPQQFMVHQCSAASSFASQHHLWTCPAPQMYGFIGGGHENSALPGMVQQPSSAPKPSVQILMLILGFTSLGFALGICWSLFAPRSVYEGILASHPNRATAPHHLLSGQMDVSASGSNKRSRSPLPKLMMARRGSHTAAARAPSALTAHHGDISPEANSFRPYSEEEEPALPMRQQAGDSRTPRHRARESGPASSGGFYSEAAEGGTPSWSPGIVLEEDCATPGSQGGGWVRDLQGRLAKLRGDVGRQTPISGERREGML